MDNPKISTDSMISLADLIALAFIASGKCAISSLSKGNKNVKPFYDPYVFAESVLNMREEFKKR